MPLVKVNVWWNKTLYKDIELDLDSPVDHFRVQLFSLSSVLPEKQKIICKGRMLKDEEWDDFKSLLVPDCKLLMIGSATEFNAATTPAPSSPENVVFIEDLPADDQPGEDLPPGLMNIDNTCYLNSVVQVLFSMSELVEALMQFEGSAEDSDQQMALTSALRDAFRTMKSSKNSVHLYDLSRVLRRHFAQFNERRNNRYVHQSADEVWVQLTWCLKKLPKIVDSPDSGDNGLSQLLEGTLTSTIRCLEPIEEEPTFQKEPFFLLECNIEGKMNYLYQGLKLGLEQELTKNSPTLCRDANYSKVSRISKLPYYLVIHFLRFYWKQEVKGGAGKRTKILRPIEFPFDLDMYEFCTDELKEKVSAKREQVYAYEANNGSGDVEVTQAPLQNETCFYELSAVITHKGRESDSGHYVAWVREEGVDDWISYNDEKTSKVGQEDIRKLMGKGGSDWHLATLCLYRTKQYPLVKKKTQS
ncbi:ubiquitin carboxyl-terminal hydrolase 14-like [Schistocerca gregaria]|uniref:ubiquitin carboxyl-terminal hydrolase 14-like n=1 Tax=Schistocerca gregaria TaxID=7010 RepID=UPI00211E2528|nr:ubiquitin carboxyl-terminal hydrolase 14-like [Schistocerca gregaria]